MRSLVATLVVLLALMVASTGVSALDTDRYRAKVAALDSDRLQEVAELYRDFGDLPRLRVYPRACGGTIPGVAYARWSDTGVYPRACGGTETTGAECLGY